MLAANCACWCSAAARARASCPRSCRRRSALLSADLRARLHVTQQARPEDLDAVRLAYARLGVQGECAPFFSDLPQRMAAVHLIVSRSGASTVAELSAIGRPAILVPLPGAIDQDQFANAGVLAEAGGAIRIVQADFTPERLASDIAALAADPARLARMAAAAKAAGTLDAAERLADLVLKIAGFDISFSVKNRPDLTFPALAGKSLSSWIKDRGRIP